MPTLTAKRHPNVPLRRLALSERMHQTQLQRGHYHVERGERLAIPVDNIATPEVFQRQRLWVKDPNGRVYRPGAQMESPNKLNSWQKRFLVWLRDNVNQDIPSTYYRAMLGHDLHVSTYGDLFGRHFHAGWTNPFDPDCVEQPLDPEFQSLQLMGLALPAGLVGFVEDLGWLSGGKVTTAFVSEEIDELVSATASEYADFDFHEVGTSSAAEANTQTALTTTSGIARVTGTPTDSDPIYQNVGTVTADASETWEEHGLFNNATSVAMMDRSLTGGQVVVSSDQVEYTYKLTKSAEA